MHAVAIVLAASALTVDYGWEKTGDGQLEYIIQIEPPLLEVLRAGGTITSEIDPQVAQVRRFRVRVGRDPVPRELPSAAIDAAGARPIEMPNEPAYTTLDPLALEPSLNDESMEPSPPAWSAALGSEQGGSEQGGTEPGDGPSLDLAADMVTRSDRAIQQPDETGMLEAQFDLEPSDNPGPRPSGNDVTTAADGQFSPLRQWDQQPQGADDVNPLYDPTDRFGADASPVDADRDGPVAATPAAHDAHDAQTDPYAPDSMQRRARDSQDSVPRINRQTALPGQGDPFGGRREEQTVYDPSVQNAAADEDLNRRSNAHGLLARTGEQHPAADANPPQETYVEPGPTNSPQSESGRSDPATGVTTRRWLPFLLTLVALFASCGLNLYLGWITWDTYCRYQRLVSDMHRRKSAGATT